MVAVEAAVVETVDELAEVKARRAPEPAWEAYDWLLMAASSQPSSSPSAEKSSFGCR